MATLDLPTDPLTAVWALIAAQIQADSTYATAGIQLVFFNGDYQALTDLSSYGGPTMRFFPRVGRGKWFDERRTSAALIVDVQAVLISPDSDDVLNLTGALATTLDTLANTTFQQSLANAGASTGLILFEQPFAPTRTPLGANGQFELAGQLVIEVMRPSY